MFYNFPCVNYISRVLSTNSYGQFEYNKQYTGRKETFNLRWKRLFNSM